MEAEKIRLRDVQETLLITLDARAMDARRANPLLGDHFAAELVDRIDYDFGRFKTNKADQFAIVIRAKQFDAWAAEFLAAHPGATVLHLGCGLDSRAFRVDPPSGIRWFDVDYPDVIELRRRFYPEREGYRMIASSATDPAWLGEIPADRPALIIAEGMFPYFPKEEAGALIRRLTGHFPGGEIAFDVLNRLARRAAGYKRPLRLTGAKLDWAVDDPKEVEALAPQLQLVSDATVIGSPYLAGLPWWFRALCRPLNAFPPLRNMMRMLRFRF